MPTLIATLTVKADKIEEARSFLSELARDTLAKEPGTVAYVGHQRKDDPTKFVFYEKYADDAAFAAHSANLKSAGAGFANILAGRPEVVFLDEL